MASNEPCLLPVLQHGCHLLSPTQVMLYCKGFMIDDNTAHSYDQMEGPDKTRRRSLTDKTRSQEQEVVYNDLNNWERDTIVVAINLWWLVDKEQYQHFKKDPSFLTYMDVVPVPQDNVEAVRRKVTQNNTLSQHVSIRINLPQTNHDMYSHLAMARTG